MIPRRRNGHQTGALHPAIAQWYLSGGNDYDATTIDPDDLLALRRHLRSTRDAEREWCARHGVAYIARFAHVFAARDRALGA